MSTFHFDIRYQRSADTKLRWFSATVPAETRDIALMMAGHAFYGELPQARVVAIHERKGH